MHSNSPPSNGPARIFNGLLRFFSSIRLGIVLIALIILYSTIGSAIPPARQFFELTEFQYFNHWIFGALIGLFCLNLTVATVRRIPFTVRNLGVLTVHTGLLTLCAGSVVYFGQKIEGDVLLLAPSIRVYSIGRSQTVQNRLLASFAVYEGKQWTTNMPALGGEYDVRVVSVRHRGMTTASEVEVDVKVGKEPVQRLTMALPTDAHKRLDPSTVEAHPEFARVNDAIALQLVPGNTSDKFYDQQTPILTIEKDGQSYDFELPTLPYYQEILEPTVAPVTDENRRKVASIRSRRIPLLDAWRLPISVIPEGSTARQDLGIDVTIDGYLPYVEMEQMPAPGGTREAPVADLTLKVGEDETDQWLFGTIPVASMFETRAGARLEFRWLGAKTELDPDWTRKVAGTHVLDVSIKDKGIHRQYDVSPGQTLAIEGTDYTVTIEQLLPSWPLMTASHKDARTAAALIWVKTPTQEFQRSVLQRYPELNQDRDRAGKKILDTGGMVDENIELKYTDCSVPHVLVAAGSALTPTAVHTAVGGGRSVRALKFGEAAAFDDGSRVTIRQIIEKPKLVDRPVVVPENRRRPQADVRRSMSAIHVNIAPRDQATAATSLWLPFSHYNGTQANMVREDTPATPVELGDGRVLMLTYGRAERPLPSPVTLERLETDYYPGRNRASGWRSHFRFIKPGTRDEVMHTSCWLNNTAILGDWHLFQATAAGDGETYTGLGVGNRRGVMPMLLGCVLISIGLIYAFTVKPMLVRRMKRLARLEAGAATEQGSRQPAAVLTGSAPIWLIAFAATWMAVSPARGETTASDSVAKLRAIESEIDTQTLGAIVVQYNARFSSLEAWARDHTERVAGPGNRLMGLQPAVAAIEMMFNSGAYAGEPLIYVKDRGLRLHLTSSKAGLTDEQRRRILKDGHVSREFLDKPAIRDILGELAGDSRIKRPMDQLSSAMFGFEQFGDDFRIVPTTSDDPNWEWHRVEDLMGNLPAESKLPRSAKNPPIPGVTAEMAEATQATYIAFAKAWRDRDVAGINSNLVKLQKQLESFAPATYPSHTQRTWEVKYYRWRLIWWAWVTYILAFFIAVFATSTGYGWARRITLILLVLALLLHAGDIGLRWYVIGRIPVANMYEAVVSSTFVGAALGLLLEFITAKRVFALATAFLGFFALALPEMNVLGITNSITTMAPILDDIMLRIHTVLIISSYAVITLGFAVANCYLFLAARKQRAIPAIVTIVVELMVILGSAGYYAWTVSGLFTAITIIVVALGAVLTALWGARLLPSLSPPPLLSLAAASAAAVPMDLPPAAGGSIGMPLYTGATRGKQLDLFKEFDRSHLILIYIANVALFVGIVLGAVWADYSWGRPWGWDPKEVFALNTWLIYAILIHARFVTKDRALWTAVLSVIGFAAMQFNWWVVNFYIVGLHSYA